MLNNTGFTLSELIQSTANELRKARDNYVNDPVIEFKACELELAVTLKAEAGGGLKFWVAESSGKISGETVSKIKLSFSPVVQQGKPAGIYAANGGSLTPEVRFGIPNLHKPPPEEAG